MGDGRDKPVISSLLNGCRGFGLVFLGVIAMYGIPMMLPGQGQVRAGEANRKETAESNVTESEVRTFAYTLFQFQRVQLFERADVRRKLQATDQQRRVLAPLAARAKSMWDRLRHLPPDRRDQLAAEFLPVAREFKQTLDKTLNPQQTRDMFRNVVREQQGAIAFLLPGVAEELELTADQQSRIEAIVDRSRRSVDWNRVRLRDIPRLLRMARENQARVDALLSASQRQRWQALRSK